LWLVKVFVFLDIICVCCGLWLTFFIMSCSHSSSSHVQGIARELHGHGHKLQGNCLLFIK
jgi:hypothetical protein